MYESLSLRNEILKKIDKFHDAAEGLLSVVNYIKVLGLDIHIDKYEPITAQLYIDLPAKLKQKKAIVNPLNEGNQCFKWAVRTALHPPKYNHLELIAKLLKENSKKFKWKDVEFPVQLDKIGIFEK